MKWEHTYIGLADKLRCIECKDAVRFKKIDPVNGLFICVKCKNVYILKNDILVCLPKSFETKAPYEHFYKLHARFFQKNTKLQNAIKKIISTLPHKRRNFWEDEG